MATTKSATNEAFEREHEARQRAAAERVTAAEAALAEAEAALAPYLAARDAARAEVSAARDAAEVAGRFPRRALTDGERELLAELQQDIGAAHAVACFKAKPGSKTSEYLAALTAAGRSLADRVQFLPDIKSAVGEIRARLGIPARPRVQTESAEDRAELARDRAREPVAV